MRGRLRNLMDVRGYDMITAGQARFLSILTLLVVVVGNGLRSWRVLSGWSLGLSVLVLVLVWVALLAWVISGSTIGDPDPEDFEDEEEWDTGTIFILGEDR